MTTGAQQREQSNFMMPSKVFPPTSATKRSLAIKRLAEASAALDAVTRIAINAGRA